VSGGIVVAIDGPAGSGKSTTAREVAKRLRYLYLDTGAMYRALALSVLASNIEPDDKFEVSAHARRIEIAFDVCEGLQRVFKDGEDVSERIRTPVVSDAASRVAVHPSVREVLISRQRIIGRDGGIVLEGRDTGTVVFPDAELKVFLVADVEERARRRVEEMALKGEVAELSVLMQQIRERDARDKETQLRSGGWPASDAIQVDTTGLAIEDQVKRVLALAIERGAELPSGTGVHR
jgi:cytidylate kinase